MGYKIILGIMFMFCFSIGSGGYTLSSVHNTSSASLKNAEFTMGISVNQSLVGKLENSNNDLGLGFWYLSSHSENSTSVETPIQSTAQNLKVEVLQSDLQAGILNLNIYLAEGETAEVKVFDIMGKEVMRSEIQYANQGANTLLLESSGLAMGVYVLRVRSGKKVVISRLSHTANRRN